MCIPDKTDAANIRSVTEGNERASGEDGEMKTKITVVQNGSRSDSDDSDNDNNKNSFIYGDEDDVINSNDIFAGLSGRGDDHHDDEEDQEEREDDDEEGIEVDVHGNATEVEGKWMKEDRERSRTNKLIRKASVAVAGGSMVVAGVAMFALPGPSFPTVVAGLHVLGKEFECAKKAEDTVIEEGKKFCQKIEKYGESNPQLVNSAKKTKSMVYEKFDSTRTKIEERHPELVKSAMNAKIKMLQTVDSAKVEFEKRRLSFAVQ